MELFVCTDLHGSREALLKIDSHLHGHTYDGVCMLGDICNSHDPNAIAYAKDFIDLIRKYSLPLFVVHGNNEPESVRLLYQYEGVSVHFNPRQIGSYSIIGVGYGDTFPTDPGFAEGKILLTHEPPRAVTIALMKKKQVLPHAPLLHLSGHLHRMAKVHIFSNTMLIQVPAAQNGRAARISLPEKTVDFLYL